MECREPAPPNHTYGHTWWIRKWNVVSQLHPRFVHIMIGVVTGNDLHIAVHLPLPNADCKYLYPIMPIHCLCCLPGIILRVITDVSVGQHQTVLSDIRSCLPACCHDALGDQQSRFYVSSQIPCFVVVVNDLIPQRWIPTKYLSLWAITWGGVVSVLADEIKGDGDVNSKRHDGDPRVIDVGCYVLRQKGSRQLTRP